MYYSCIDVVVISLPITYTHEVQVYQQDLVQVNGSMFSMSCCSSNSSLDADEKTNLELTTKSKTFRQDLHR